MREVLEDLESEVILRGAHTGVYNLRGVFWRGEGGKHERDIAENYRKWGQALQTSHPYVSSRLLLGLGRTYEREANQEDIEADIRRQLR